MTKFLATVLLITAVAPNAFAGPLLSFGIRGGTSSADAPVDYDGERIGTTTKEKSIIAGPFADVGLGPIGAMIDVLYARRKLTHLHDPWAANYSFSYSQIFVPIQIRLGLGPVRITGGAYYAMGLGKVTADGTIFSGGPSFNNEEIEFGGDYSLQKTDSGLTGGVGISFLGLSVDVRYSMGSKDMLTGWYRLSSRKFHSLDLLAGYQF